MEKFKENLLRIVDILENIIKNLLQIMEIMVIILKKIHGLFGEYLKKHFEVNYENN